MKESFTAKTLEEAKQMASEKFGVSVDYIVFRILEKPKKGFLGLGKKEEYVVEAAYEPMETPAAAPAPAAPAEPVPAEKPAAPAAAPETAPAQPEAKTEEAAPAEATAAEAITSVDEIVIPQDDSATRGVESAAIETILTDEEMSENLLRARQYIADIYHAMGIDIAITTMRTENGIRMELRSQTKSGTIIGRRGETLDSIQYLASILVNRDGEEYCRLLLDSNGYREKRRKTLEQLADKIARSVLRSGRSTTLEPMNPYERRIIHSRISEIEGVTSHSVGEEPVPEGGRSCCGRKAQRRTWQKRRTARPWRKAPVPHRAEAGGLQAQRYGLHEDQLRAGL